MSITKHHSVELSLTDEELTELEAASRILKTKPDNLAVRLLHEFLAKTRSYQEDPIWDFVGSGSSRREDWSTNHTRRMVSGR